ncbi:MAG: ATP-dependent Clp protease ATP-binding subunit ClpX [Clostridia bacterium]|nr:ATP-dependent Clp protease ATP-binding subunit ClpX [Clostridia bacterium]
MVKELDINDTECIACGKKETDGVNLVKYKDICICEECINNLYNYLYDEEDFASMMDSLLEEDTIEFNKKTLPTPKQIKERLDEVVIGQEKPKIILSVAVYNHFKRIAMESSDKNKNDKNLKDVQIEKSNVLMLGPTGTGKTLIAKTLAEILDVPFAIADATTLTEAGYVGQDVENVVYKLYVASNRDVKKCERGIIYIDEIDKIRKRESATHDVRGESVQQALLKIIEGKETEFPEIGGPIRNDSKLVTVNTKNILFIVGGSFVGIENIIKNRTSSSSIGFAGDLETEENKSDEYKKIMSKIVPTDIISYGMIPEFIGRIPVITVLDPLSEDDLVSILTKPKNALVKQYMKILQFNDVELKFTKDAVREIARESYTLNTGARGLKSIVERTMLNVMYTIPSLTNVQKVIINGETIKQKKEPELVLKTQTN